MMRVILSPSKCCTNMFVGFHTAPWCLRKNVRKNLGEAITAALGPRLRAGYDSTVFHNAGPRAGYDSAVFHNTGPRAGYGVS